MFEELHNYRKQRAWLRQLASPVFVVALAVGVILHLVGFLVFRVMTSELPAPVEKSPFVNYVNPKLLARQSQLEEQAMLFDSAPLFIPTQWSATRSYVAMGRDSVGDGFTEFEPQIDVLSELKPEGFMEDEAGAVATPDDLLALRYWDLFSNMGRTDIELEPYQDALPVAKIQVLDHAASMSGKMDRPFELDVVLEYVPSGLLDRPVRALVLISGAGRVLSGPTLIQASGDSEFDQAILAWLEQADVAVRMPAGYLEVEIYP